MKNNAIKKKNTNNKLGCWMYTAYLKFIYSPKKTNFREQTVWLGISVPSSRLVSRTPSNGGIHYGFHRCPPVDFNCIAMYFIVVHFPLDVFPWLSWTCDAGKTGYTLSRGLRPKTNANNNT